MDEKESEDKVQPLPLPDIFLLGGGWLEDGFVRTLWHFVDLITVENNRCRLLVILADEEGLDKEEAEKVYRAVFEVLAVTPEEITVIFVSPDHPLTEEQVAAHRPTGVFVGGGLTPVYHKALCSNPAWLGYLTKHQIPYAGYSAGAALAADRAILGGWKLSQRHKDVPIVHENCADGLEFLELQPGLGLVPFAVESHAGQWGTVTRLMHAVNAGLIDSGWAIDENTMLRVTGGKLAIYGLGYAYRVHRVTAGSVQIDIIRPGTEFALDAKMLAAAVR